MLYIFVGGGAFVISLIAQLAHEPTWGIWFMLLTLGVILGYIAELLESIWAELRKK